MAERTITIPVSIKKMVAGLGSPFPTFSTVSNARSINPLFAFSFAIPFSSVIQSLYLASKAAFNCSKACRITLRGQAAFKRINPERLRPKAHPSFRPKPAFSIINARSSSLLIPNSLQSSQTRYVASGTLGLICGIFF